MIRTQIYLNEADKKTIERFCSATGKTQSEIIRIAIANYIKDQQLTLDNSAFGIWKDNNYDFNNLRNELDRDSK